MTPADFVERVTWVARISSITLEEAHGPRERVLSGEGLEALGAAIRSFEGTRLDPDPIRFLALSGLRKREALGQGYRGSRAWHVHQGWADWIAAAMDGRNPRLGEKMKPK